MSRVRWETCLCSSVDGAIHLDDTSSANLESVDDSGVVERQRDVASALASREHRLDGGAVAYVLVQERRPQEGAKPQRTECMP